MTRPMNCTPQNGFLRHDYFSFLRSAMSGLVVNRLCNANLVDLNHRFQSRKAIPLTKENLMATPSGKAVNNLIRSSANFDTTASRALDGSNA